jgi:hypothetical protein
MQVNTEEAEPHVEAQTQNLIVSLVGKPLLDIAEEPSMEGCCGGSKIIEQF